MMDGLIGIVSSTFSLTGKIVFTEMLTAKIHFCRKPLKNGGQK